MATSLQVAGLASNFDWKTFIDQVMALERTPASRLESEQSSNTAKVNLLATLGTRFTAVKDAATALSANNLFGGRTAKLNTAGSTWSASAGAGTVAGNYTFAVSQLATAARLTGASDIGQGLNPASNDVSGLTIASLPLGQSVTAGSFTVNGKQVSVALTDSLEDVFNAISTATDGDVTASYDHTTDKITLNSAGGSLMLGAASDTSNFLRALKLGNNGSGTVISSATLGTVKSSATLANANLGTPITAVDGAGEGSFAINGVAISYNVNTDSLSAVLGRINASAAGVTASFDPVTDRVVLVNKSTGDLGITVAESSGGLLDALGLKAGSTFTTGKNAEFTLDGGAVLTSGTNTLDESAHGIAGLSLTVTSEETQTISVAANASAMRSKIETFISKFNEAQQYLDSITRITSDGKGKVTAAALSTNREIQEWGRSLRSLAFNTVGGLSGSIDQLSDLGIDFRAGTNELEIKDGAKLDAALTNASGDVSEFFTKGSTGFVARFETFLANVDTQNKDQQKRLGAANTSLDSQIEAIDRHLEQRRSLLEAAFIQMERAQSMLKQQQSAIENAFPKKAS